jgi:hypothetical protein
MCKTSEREQSIRTWRYGSGTQSEAVARDTDLEAGHREGTVDNVGTEDLEE